MNLINSLIVATEGVNMEILTALINTSPTLVFLYLFIAGKIMPETVVDRILKEAEARSAKITQDILDGMKEAVKQGHLEADAEINGRH